MARLTERFFMGGNPTDVETLFIMESPGKCELVCDYACVGLTGNVMSKYLCANDSVPLGCYLKNGYEKKYAIFETFMFPIEKRWQNSDNDEFEQNMSNIKEIDNNFTDDSSRQEHYEGLNIFWNESPFLKEKKEFVNQYKKDLKKIVSLHNIKEIVVCGYIAQSCFMQAFIPGGFQNGFPPYGYFFNISKTKKPRLYFSNHPSVELHKKSKKKWKYGCDYICGKILIGK